MKRDRHDTPEKVGKFSNGGGKKWVPLWMKRTVTPKVEPMAEPVKKNYSFRINFGWVMVAVIIYLLFHSCNITVITN